MVTLMDFFKRETEFYRDFSRLTRFYWVLLSFTGFYWVSKFFPGADRKRERASSSLKMKKNQIKSRKLGCKKKTTPIWCLEPLQRWKSLGKILTNTTLPHFHEIHSTNAKKKNPKENTFFSELKETRTTLK